MQLSGMGQPAPLRLYGAVIEGEDHRDRRRTDPVRGLADSHLVRSPCRKHNVAMDVYEAVRSRHSVRGFLDRPVPPEVLTRVLTAALQSPSGGNLQPWHVYVLSSTKLEGLKARIRERVAAQDSGDQPPVLPYPLPLAVAYAQRLEDMGARRYGAIGVARDDREARARVRAGNWECWGATTALFCYLDEGMFPPQWMDVGMFLQSVMLLFRTEGMDTCPQIAWAEYHKTVAEVIEPPSNLILACGMSIGYADPRTPRPDMPRAHLCDVVRFCY
jgi:nitroreductase